MNEETQNTQKEARKPDWKLSLVRETQFGDQWAGIAVGWLHKDGEGIGFTNDFLKMFGFKIIARKIERKP